nr:formin-like protein 20 [Aegilops tauschii subsp. strangulata]
MSTPPPNVSTARSHVAWTNLRPTRHRAVAPIHSRAATSPLPRPLRRGSREPRSGPPRARVGPPPARRCSCGSAAPATASSSPARAAAAFPELLAGAAHWSAGAPLRRPPTTPPPCSFAASSSHAWIRPSPPVPGLAGVAPLPFWSRSSGGAARPGRPLRARVGRMSPRPRAGPFSPRGPIHSAVHFFLAR